MTLLEPEVAVETVRHECAGDLRCSICEERACLDCSKRCEAGMCFGRAHEGVCERRCRSCKARLCNEHVVECDGEVHCAGCAPMDTAAERLAYGMNLGMAEARDAC